MCGRFTLTVPSYDELADALGVEPPPGMDLAYKPRFNIAPTDPTWIVRMNAGIRELVSAKWGLVPRWSKPGELGQRPINARAESVAKNPMFRGSLERRRCIVAADGFFEWKKTPSGKDPYWIHPTSGGLMLMAGLWDRTLDEATGERHPTFTIVTTQGSRDMVGLHDRMPVILSGADIQAWLNVPGRNDPAPITSELRALLAPAPSGTLTATHVSRRVNSVKNDDPACLEPETEKPDNTLSLFDERPAASAKKSR